jgi:hypothetical protein
MCNHRRSSVIDRNSTDDDDSLPSLVSYYSDDSSTYDNSDDEPVSSDLNNSNNHSNNRSNNNNGFTGELPPTGTLDTILRNNNSDNSIQQINGQLERDRIRIFREINIRRLMLMGEIRDRGTCIIVLDGMTVFSQRTPNTRYTTTVDHRGRIIGVQLSQ